MEVELDATTGSVEVALVIGIDSMEVIFSELKFSESCIMPLNENSSA